MAARHRALFAMLLLALCGSGPLRAKENPERLLAALPKNIADCQQSKPQDYGGPLGNSVDYDRDGLHITVYAYDMGKATIEEGIGDPTVLHAFQISESEIQDAVKKGIYSHALPYDDSFGNGVAKNDWHPKVLISTYRLTRNGIEYRSQIVVYGARNHIIKLRISTDRLRDKEMIKAIDRFVPELMEAIKQLPKSDAI